jgi:hypothetical protein
VTAELYSLKIMVGMLIVKREMEPHINTLCIFNVATTIKFLTQRSACMCRMGFKYPNVMIC